jgi:hypothetical protein
MTVSFDLYTHRNKLYHRLVWSAIVGLLVAAACLVASNYLASIKFLYGLAIALILGYVLFMMAFFFIVGYGMLQTYEKDGELVLSDESIMIDGVQVPVKNAGHLFLRLRPRTNRSGWRRIGNRVELTDADGKTYNRLFCINSYDHNEELLKMMKKWSESGVKYDIKYTVF